MPELTFASKLNDWKKRMNLSGKEAAAALDIDYPTYRKYSAGKRTPSRLAKAMILIRMGGVAMERQVKMPGRD